MSVGLLSLLLLLFGPGTDAPESEEGGLEFANGLWYRNGSFEPGLMYVEAGILRTEKPANIVQRIDLGGLYVVPPFGEAHTHRPADPRRFTDGGRFFLDDGIFYVMNQGSLARYREPLRKRVGSAQSIDALFANALVASPQSHGVELWQRLAKRGTFAGVEIDSLEGDAYFVVESNDELARKWPAILATQPDFLKIMVEHSEDYPRRRSEPEFFGRSGLDPELVADIVSLAHDAGLRVSAHVETAADFQLVVGAGVDIVAHLPGYDIPTNDPLDKYRITAAAAAVAAEKETTVVTTTLLSADRAENEPGRLERMRRNQRQNLELLTHAGVRLAVGSDQFSQNAVDEILNLASLGVFDKRTLLEMLCRDTPRAIFPRRHLGVLEDGAEASFLVLKNSPLDDLRHLRAIALRVKNGRILESPVESAG